MPALFSISNTEQNYFKKRTSQSLNDLDFIYPNKLEIIVRLRTDNVLRQNEFVLN